MRMAGLFAKTKSLDVLGLCKIINKNKIHELFAECSSSAIGYNIAIADVMHDLPCDVMRANYQNRN